MQSRLDIPAEQRESRHYNKMADMFSMGVILTEFLTIFSDNQHYISVLLDLSCHQSPSLFVNL